MKQEPLAAILITTGMMNAWFEMFNPILTGIFYLVSITWLFVQIYFKIKYKK